MPACRHTTPSASSARLLACATKKAGAWLWRATAFAIYLWGYAAEMLLKAAYFRLSGKGSADRVTLADLNNAKQHAQTVLHLPWPGNLHQLPSWARLLIEERRRLAVPYAPFFARALASRVRHVYINWREHLRYRPNLPYQGEVARTYQALTWLVGQYHYL